MTTYKTRRKHNPQRALIAHHSGVPESLIADLQRKNHISKDLADISDADMQFLLAIAKMLGVEELVRLQWSRDNVTIRQKLVETADDFELDRWERWLLSRYLNIYSKTLKPGQAVVIDEKMDERILLELRHFQNTDLTAWVRARAHELKTKARQRVAHQKRKNLHPIK